MNSFWVYSILWNEFEFIKQHMYDYTCTLSNLCFLYFQLIQSKNYFKGCSFFRHWLTWTIPLDNSCLCRGSPLWCKTSDPSSCWNNGTACDKKYQTNCDFQKVFVRRQRSNVLWQKHLACIINRSVGALWHIDYQLTLS